MPRRPFSVKDNGAIVMVEARCVKSDGRRWRCPMPAHRHTGLCKLHLTASRREIRNSQNNASDSDPPNPNPDPLPNEVESEVQEVDRSSMQEPEAVSDFEKLHQPLNMLVRKKRRRRKKEIKEIGSGSGRISEDLIRMAVKRQMERKEKRKREMRVEVRRELPNGVMEISGEPAARVSGNGNGFVEKKLGLGFGEGGNELRRRFRSKNVEPEAVGVVKKFPRGSGMRRRKVGHRIREKKTESGMHKG